MIFFLGGGGLFGFSISLLLRSWKCKLIHKRWIRHTIVKNFAYICFIKKEFRFAPLFIQFFPGSLELFLVYTFSGSLQLWFQYFGAIPPCLLNHVIINSALHSPIAHSRHIINFFFAHHYVIIHTRVILQIDVFIC